MIKYSYILEVVEKLKQYGFSCDLSNVLEIESTGFMRVVDDSVGEPFTIRLSSGECYPDLFVYMCLENRRKSVILKKLNSQLYYKQRSLPQDQWPKTCFVSWNDYKTLIRYLRDPYSIKDEDNSVKIYGIEIFRAVVPDGSMIFSSDSVNKEK